MKRSERIATSVTPEQKIDFHILATRQDKKEAELLRDIVEDYLDDHDIPDEVRDYFREAEEGNPNPTPTAD